MGPFTKWPHCARGTETSTHPLFLFFLFLFSLKSSRKVCTSFSEMFQRQTAVCLCLQSRLIWFDSTNWQKDSLRPRRGRWRSTSTLLSFLTNSSQEVQLPILLFDSKEVLQITHHMPAWCRDIFWRDSLLPNDPHSLMVNIRWTDWRCLENVAMWFPLR